MTYIDFNGWATTIVYFITFVIGVVGVTLIVICFSSRICLLIASQFVFSLLFYVRQVLNHLCNLAKLLLFLLRSVFVVINRIVGNSENIVVIFNDVTTLGIELAKRRWVVQQETCLHFLDLRLKHLKRGLSSNSCCRWLANIHLLFSLV